MSKRGNHAHRDTAGPPWVMAGLLCELVLEEKNGQTSLVHLIDGIRVARVGPRPPAEMPPFPRQVFYIVQFGGVPAGTFYVSLRLVSPSKRVTDLGTVETVSKGERNPVRVNADLTIDVDEPGTYWFETYVANRLMTRAPLHVEFAGAGE